MSCIVSFSKDENEPRLEIQLALPDNSGYIVIGEFYNFKNNETMKDEIFKIVKAGLSNSVKIVKYYHNNKLFKTSYEYGYYIDNNVKMITEIFNNKFIFPWVKKFKTSTFFYDPWILTDFTKSS